MVNITPYSVWFYRSIKLEQRCGVCPISPSCELFRSCPAQMLPAAWNTQAVRKLSSTTSDCAATNHVIAANRLPHAPPPAPSPKVAPANGQLIQSDSHFHTGENCFETLRFPGACVHGHAHGRCVGASILRRCGDDRRRKRCGHRHAVGAPLRIHGLLHARGLRRA